ncbi:chromosomal replication initiator protein DnaA [Parabacteroides sp. FAFU027]|uniref:chromosomal replication initiator protein DnaA n=1 Tax=Parabacteroides sp. FAFU027 TaxID=2922715 RepID=UPI001FAF371B|nr:chromosomal replication initiator protein DnaA [Parabacteroides sp. FAFU027]
MKLTHNEIWDKCLRIISDNVSEAAYNTWFVPIVPLQYHNHELLIQVPSPFFYEYLEEKFIDLLQNTIHRVAGRQTKLMYRVLVENETKSTSDWEGAPSFSEKKKQAPVNELKRVPDPFAQRVYQDLDPQLNFNYTFENFFAGMSNKLTRTAGETIARNPGKTAFNPLFIHGESGVGKTHLLNAIGSMTKHLHQSKRVLYVSTHLFQIQYTDAVRNNSVNDFINFYQSIDLLLIDDIQELGGKIATQNTFFHIFNHLHQNNKQLVMTSDRPPVSLHGLEQRLLTRFKWGLTAELEKPDYLLRKTILRNKVRHDGLSINDDVLEYIANNVTENVRDMEGVIVSLMAHSMVYNRDVDIDLAERVLSKCVKFEKKEISTEQILDKVCEYFSLDQKMVNSKSRKREYAQARQISMYLAKKHTDQSFSRIGELIGKKDHATVLHACKTIKNLIEIDKNLRSQIDEIEKELKM